MQYLNQFHKESTERMLRKLEEWKKSPTSSLEAAQTMKRNMAQGASYGGCIYSEQKYIEQYADEHNCLIHTGSYYKLFKRLLMHNDLFP